MFKFPFKPMVTKMASRTAVYNPSMFFMALGSMRNNLGTMEFNCDKDREAACALFSDLSDIEDAVREEQLNPDDAYVLMVGKVDYFIENTVRPYILANYGPGLDDPSMHLNPIEKV